MDKLYAIKIKQSDGTYGVAIPISVLAENVDWNDSLNLVDILGEVDTSESIQDQINRLRNTKANQSTINMLSQKIDNAVNFIINNSEIADARMGYDGSMYESLGIAIRTQIANIKQMKMGYTSEEEEIYFSNTNSNNMEVNNG